MLAGLGVTLYYMASNASGVRAALGLDGSGLWFGIQPISSGVFGVPAGVFVVWLLSMLWPDREPRGPAPQNLTREAGNTL
jgi:cation/acetate symporter